ncbi:MAG: 2-isopropylmalate synthase [Lachnospiraceae bacterium]|nr:2-isopropylmalate synthase [Lachnospiraceae bacterium]
MDFNKYERQYYLAPSNEYDWVKREYIKEAPKWCSVDLRDGNQALTIPMSLDEKLEFFDLLVQIGFKEIEVGFPAASETEYNFLRKLIEEDRIPDDVTIQVLTQSREHIIKKTFEALKGVKHAIVHLYNSTSVAQREQVFKKSKEEIIDIAVEGAKLFNKYVKDAEGEYRFEYSPESFTGTEPEYALEICNRVLDVWKPTKDRKAIINLPVTVELSLPHIYANQIEYMHKNLKYRDCIEISLHPHNDRGCAVADAELGLLAGADRIEGTLFGNGERTGNVDVITVAMNMFTHGVDPKLDFSDMSFLVDTYQRVTRMKVNERSPYSGKLVFCAFSGSHQDAIAKGMKCREEKGTKIWDVPYLPLDPKDVGRTYETDVIRINSQSGKGGIGYLLEHRFGYVLPTKMRTQVSYRIKHISDVEHKELSPAEIEEIFRKEYINIETPMKLVKFYFEKDDEDDIVHANIKVELGGRMKELKGNGNGRFDAVSDALQQMGVVFSDLTYHEHALEIGTKSRAASYVGIQMENGKEYWGVGVHTDIITSSLYALFSAVNKGLLAELTDAEEDD